VNFGVSEEKWVYVHGHADMIEQATRWTAPTWVPALRR
jgi:hypothetical protein